MPVETTAAGAAVLELERFEFATPERIEVVGHWSSLRGRRFMRPTLVLKGEGEPKRLLADLEHKPWTAVEGEEWIAAFAWNGDVVRFESAELNVGAGLDLELPAPRMRPGKPARFRKRIVARDTSRPVELPGPKAKGIVSDSPAAEPDPDATQPMPAESKPPSATAADPDATQPLPAASAAPATADPDTPTTPAAGAPAEPAAADPPDQDAGLQARIAEAEAAADRLRTERNQLRRDRDQALEKLRTLRGELEAERQAREQAVNDARAAERESANRMLGEGVELRASIERQREIAYLERDDAKTARDEAIAARDKACEERDGALAEAKEARRERKEAFAQRDRAVKLRERAEAERTKAVAEQELAVDERDAAVKERDEVVGAYERGLPVAPPKPRFLPEEHEQRSHFDIWGPRASALAVLLFCAFIVLKLIACA
jgi:hypothetical protein